jgi:hypothetical protein
VFARVRSETPENEIELNIVMLIRAAKAFGVQVILSTRRRRVRRQRAHAAIDSGGAAGRQSA